MLVKLMKHEFHATGRVSLPLCGVMLALSVVAGMALRFTRQSRARSGGSARSTAGASSPSPSASSPC